MKGYIILAAVIFFLLAGLHIYWAFGGRWGSNVVLPRNGAGQPKFSPGPGAILLVAAMLIGAGLLLLLKLTIASPAWAEGLLGWLCFVGMLVLGCRGILGYLLILFSSASRQASNLKWELFLYSPLCFLLALAFGLAWRF